MGTLNQNRLELLSHTMQQDITAGLYHGAVVLVAHQGKIYLHQALGHSDLANQRAAQTDDVFHLMSITKQLTTTIVLAAIEQGKFSLNTKVAEVIPEFAAKGKQNITVYHLLTHTSGMNPELPLSLAPGGHIHIDQLVAAISDERLFRRPGKTVTYNPYGAHSVLAEMVCRLDEAKRPFRQIMAEDLLKPLGMKSTSLSLREDLAERRVPIVPAFDNDSLFDPEAFHAMNLLATEDAEFAAAGAMGTAKDLFRFTEMLRLKGSYENTQILSPAMVENALRNHTGDTPNDIFDYTREMHTWPDWPAYIGLTFFLRGEGTFPCYMGTNTSPGTFCGEGAGSTIFWVDPERELTFICLTAGIMDETENMLRFQRLSDMVVAAYR